MVERWVKSTVSPDWTVILGWGTFWIPAADSPRPLPLIAPPWKLPYCRGKAASPPLSVIGNLYFCRPYLTSALTPCFCACRTWDAFNLCRHRWPLLRWWHPAAARRDEREKDDKKIERTNSDGDGASKGGGEHERKRVRRCTRRRAGSGSNEDRASRGGGWLCTAERKERLRKRKSDGRRAEDAPIRTGTETRGGTTSDDEAREEIERVRCRVDADERARGKAGGRERRRASAYPAERARRPHMCSETNVRSECRLLPIIRCRGVPLCARGWSADSVPRFYAARQPGLPLTEVFPHNDAARRQFSQFCGDCTTGVTLQKPSENPGLRPESRERTSPSSAARPTKRIVCIRGAAERVAAGHSPPINEGEARAAPPVF
ncbi:hypothetical protein ALC56_08653 [Trachymyrmex septentrionalis]|uniref:Uncharacterized protein n=1 Tax=Trachymyrmex septentrionalis TaxID=34720 RepID=A0A195F9H3_9HYME|nr:hypothetical protein ALC56_08653 [Trachymyrmex septentrionalis]